MLRLDRLVWMKNVNDPSGKKAYPGFFVGEPFDLNWPNSKVAKANAAKLPERDQIILVQHDHVTHIIELIGTTVGIERNSDYPYFRTGKVIWSDNNDDYLFKDVMGFEHRFTNGLALDIPRRPKFKHRWGAKGLPTFQRHVAKAVSAVGSKTSHWDSLQSKSGSSAGKKDEPFRIPEEVDASVEHYEGNVDQILVNRYERDPAVRNKCIARHGTKCTICGFDFVSTYGEFMKGFIHVHHLKPLARAGKRHKVDPVQDLRPVCPNCHAAIHHRLNPPYSINEIKKCLGFKSS